MVAGKALTCPGGVSTTVLILTGTSVCQGDRCLSEHEH
jgi:hypothetical protein